MEIDTNNHSVFLLNYHLIFVIKYRRKVINEEILNSLKAYKFRIYPDNEQRIYLAKTFGYTRFIYNQMLADIIKSY